MSARHLILGTIVAAATLMIVGSVLSYATLPLARLIHSQRNTFVGIYTFAINAASYALTLVALWLLRQRFTGARSAVAGVAFELGLGYSAIALAIGLLRQTITPAWIAFGNATQISPTTNALLFYTVLPLVILVIVFVLAGLMPVPEEVNDAHP
jgi:hypothetical protein